MTFNDKKQMRYGVILSYISLVVSLLGTFLITNRVLDFVGDKNYGLYSFVLSISSWLTIITAALNASFVRFSTLESSGTGGDSSRINSIYLKLFVFISAFLFLLGSSIVLFFYFGNFRFANYNINDSKTIYLLLFLSLINVSFTIPSSLFTLYISFKKKFIFKQLVSIMVNVLNFIGHFIIAYYTNNIIYISIYSIGTTILAFLLNFFMCKKVYSMNFMKVSLKENKLLIKSILIFSSILLLNSIVDQINNSVDKILLGIFATPEDVTIYHFGHQFPVYMSSMSVAISSVYVPYIHQKIVDDDCVSINNLFLKVSRTQTMIIVGIAFGFAACGMNFVNFWIGHARIRVYYVALILLILNICPLTMNCSIEIQRARNKHLFRAIAYFLAAIFNVLLSIILINVFPVEKAIYACIIGTVITTIGSHWIAMNLYNLLIMKLPIGKYLLNLFVHIIFGVVVTTLIQFSFKNVTIENEILLFLLKGVSFSVSYIILILVFNYKFIFKRGDKKNES